MYALVDFVFDSIEQVVSVLTKEIIVRRAYLSIECAESKVFCRAVHIIMAERVSYGTAYVRA